MCTQTKYHPSVYTIYSPSHQTYCEFSILNIQIYSGRCFAFISKIEYEFTVYVVRCFGLCGWTPNADGVRRTFYVGWWIEQHHKKAQRHIVNPWNPNEVKSLIKLRLKSHNLHPCHSFSFDKKKGVCNVMRLWVALPRCAWWSSQFTTHLCIRRWPHSNFILIQSNIIQNGEHQQAWQCR